MSKHIRMLPVDMYPSARDELSAIVFVHMLTRLLVVLVSLSRRMHFSHHSNLFPPTKMSVLVVHENVV